MPVPAFSPPPALDRLRAAQSTRRRLRVILARKPTYRHSHELSTYEKGGQAGMLFESAKYRWEEDC